MREFGVVRAQEAADVGERVFLGGHRAAVGVTENFPCDVDGRRILVAGLAPLDEVCVLREATGIDIERYAGLSRDAADLFDIRHRYGLTATRVVRDRHHDERYAITFLGDELLEGFGVHVALERERGIEIGGFGAGQVDGLGTVELDVGARRVEMRVVRHDRAGFHHDAEQDVLGGASLVRRDHLLEAEDVLDRVAEAVPAACAGVGFVAAHQLGPGIRRHGARAGVGQQVDDDVFGAQQERVEMRGLDQLFTLVARGQLDGLDHLDPERLDDGLQHAEAPWG